MKSAGYKKALKKFQEQRAQEKAEKKSKQSRARYEKQFSKARSKFRPRKSERQTFVFLSLQGKRLPLSSDRKGYLFYVPRRGRFYAVGATRAQPPRPKRVGAYDVERTGKKHALAGFFAEHFVVSGPFTFRGTGQRGVDLDKVAQHLARELRRAAQSRADETFLIDGQVYLDGIKRAIGIRFKFSKRFSQGRIDYRGFARAKMFFHVGHELDMRNIVSRQSAAHVERLLVEGKKINRGKRRGKWENLKRNKKGDVIGLEQWSRRDNKEKKIRAVEYKISRVIIRA